MVCNKETLNSLLDPTSMCWRTLAVASPPRRNKEIETGSKGRDLRFTPSRPNPAEREVVCVTWWNGVGVVAF